MRFQSLSILVLIAGLALISQPLRATADAEATESEAFDPQATVEEELLVEDRAPYLPSSTSTATKSSRPLRLIPASVSALSHSMLEDRNSLVLGDALTNVAGVNAQSNSGVHDLFFIRGFDSLSSSLVMTDGAPEPEATFYQLYNIERVEVIRGPSGFLYGGNPIAGTVNMIRKRPVAGTQVTLGGLFGSHSTSQVTLDANSSRSNGRAGFRINGLWQTSDGYRDDKQSDVVAVNPVFTFLAGQNTSVNVSFDYLRSEFSPDAGIPLLLGEIPDVPRERSYQTPFDFSDQEVSRLRIDIESRLSDRWTLRNKTYFNKLDWESKGTLINAAVPFPDGSVPVFRTRSVLDDTQEFLGNQLEFVFRADGGSIRHTLTAGLDISQLTDKLEFGAGLLPTIDLFSPVETAPPTDFLIPQFGMAADAETTIIAPYVLDEIAIGDRWTAFVGLRFDELDFTDKLSGASRTDSELSPFLGVMVDASENISLYANYSEAFSPPSTLGGIGNEPEQGRQTEIGIKSVLLDGRLRANLALFDLEKDNIAIPDPVTFLPTQQGDQDSKGFELELNSSITDNLHWTFSYAYTDAELVEYREAIFQPFPLVLDFAGNRPSYTPEHMVNFWMSHRAASGFGIAGGVRYVDEQFIDEDNAFAIDDYITMDALLSFEQHGWGVRLHLRNLTDEEYEGRGFGGASVLPADGFNAMAGFVFNL